MTGDLKTLKNDYLEYLEIERNRSRRTVENYGRYLDRFIQFSKASTIDQVTEDGIRQYRLYLNRFHDDAGAPLKHVTQNYHIIALRNFLKYLAKRGIQAVAPERIELGRQEERQVTFLERGELDRLLDAPALLRSEELRTGKKGNELGTLRDRAMLATLFSTGMRVSELCSLDRDMVNGRQGEISVRGKGGKVRVVFLSERAKDDLSQYLTKRPDVDEALFIRIPKSGTFGKDDDLRLTPRTVQRLVKKYATQAGIIGKKVSPHTLRHSYATDLLRNGADIRSVQAMLGHSSVTTTQIYTHVTDTQLREIHRKFHGKK
ncbi:MAG: site-specific tyrosine recombinase/integron integrase [Patescibacteria group bacterium]